MKPKTELRRSRDFGEIINDTIIFISQNWKPLLKTYFTFCGFFVACNLIFSVLFQLKVVSVHKDTIDFSTTSRTAIFGIEYFLLIIFGLLNIVSITITSLCYVTLYNENKNQPPTLNEMWGYFKYYFFRVLGSMLLLGIIFAVALIICVIPSSIIIAVSGASGGLLGGIVAFFCIIIPFAYLVTVFGLFFPIMISENASFGYTFSKCFKLIKGKWWSTFGVFFVMAIIVYAAYLLVLIPFGIISGGTITFLSYNVATWVILLYGAMMSIMQVINIVPMVSSSIAYYSYAEDKESIGLAERINTLGTGPDELDPINDEY